MVLASRFASSCQYIFYINYNILSRDFNYLPGGHLEVKLIVWVLWISLTSLLDVRQVSMQGQKVREEEAHGGDDALVPKLDGILDYVLLWLLYQNGVLFYSPVILKQKNILITSKQVEFIAHNNLFLWWNHWFTVQSGLWHFWDNISLKKLIC